MCEQIINPHRVVAFKAVFGGHHVVFVLKAQQRFVQRVNEVGFNGIFDDRVALVGHGGDMLFCVFFFHGASPSGARHDSFQPSRVQSLPHRSVHVLQCHSQQARAAP